MIRVLRWIGWVLSLSAIYAAIGMLGGGVALLVAAAYAYPNAAFAFFCGILTAVAIAQTRRHMRRRGRRVGSQPLRHSVRSIITHDWHHDHRKAA